MGKQAVKVELFYGGSWHDVAAADQVFADTPITIVRGGTDETPTPRPSTITLRLNNDDDRFRTSNPMSPLYGLAGVNTPLRVSVGSAIRGYGQASSWSCDETSDFRPSPARGMAWADLQAGGLLQQIGQWSRSIKSPLRLASESIPSSVGYWPLEDPAGTLVASSPLPGVRNTLLAGHSFGSQNSPPGGGTAVDCGANPAGIYQCLPGNPTSTLGWQVNRVIYLNKFTYKPGDSPHGGDSLILGRTAGDSLFSFSVDGSNLQALLHMGDPVTGAELLGATQDVSGYSWLGRWIMVHLQASYSAGTTFVSVYWRATDETVWQTFSDSYTGVPSELLNLQSFLPEGSSYGHYIGARGLTDDLKSDARHEAFCGHPRERAAYRFARVNDENGVPYYVSNGFDSSRRMGPQGAQPLTEIYGDIQGTDDALIFDHRSEGRVFLLSVVDRLNQTPALTIDPTVPGHGMPSRPAEVSDDVPVHNIVTAKQRGGGDFTAEDTTSSADPPAGRGPYKQDVNVNVAFPDVDLEQEANWWLARGTVTLPRYPQVSIDMTRLSAPVLAAVEAVDIGSVIEIVHYRENPIRLYVLGSKETIGTHTRGIVFNCAPDQQFNAGVLDTGRLAARSTTLNADITASATSLTLKITDPDERWRTGSNAVPVLIGGERITLGTVAAAAGTGPWTQAVTGCTRAVNAIVKPHVAGDPVTVVGAITLTLGDGS